MRFLRRPVRGQRLRRFSGPHLHGAVWPDAAGASSFAASTLAARGREEAFSAEAHDVADAVEAVLVPLLWPSLCDEVGDRPGQHEEAHLRQSLGAAARLGAGVGLVAVQQGLAGGDPPGSPGAPSGWVHRDVLEAVDRAWMDAPRLGGAAGATASWLQRVGFLLAVCGTDAVDDLAREVRGERSAD